jgi:hypothetical protein
MNTTNNKGAPSQGTPPTPQSNSNSAQAQRQRLLERLRIDSVDTLTARCDLDILHPAARAMELRKRGYQIKTVWIKRPTDCGKLHRIGLYILQPGEGHE